MQDKPRAPELLEAVADFLIKEVLPAVKENDSLAYKTLVSWNMLGVVAREFREGEASARSEFARLADLSAANATPAVNYPELLEQLERMNAELSLNIRENGWSNKDSAVWAAVRETVREKLRISNPRFGTDSE